VKKTSKRVFFITGFSIINMLGITVTNLAGSAKTRLKRNPQ